MPRRSGRYPWGSGDDPYQHSEDFLSRVEKLKQKGWTETPENIKKAFGLTTSQYRVEVGICNAQRRAVLVDRAKSLRDDGLNNSEIGRQMGVRESTVRSWFNAESESRMQQAFKTAEFLKSHVDEKKMVDVGVGVERELGISKEKLAQSLYILERDGYKVYSGGVKQGTNPGQQTTQKVLCVPGTEHKEIYQFDKVHSLMDYHSHDGGETFTKFVYPKSMDSKRLHIRYADEVGPDGAKGIEKDGLIELRRGVADIALPEGKRYAQVRILVDNDKYIKGMAVYSDKMPDGVDVVFNTNRTPDKGIEGTLKKIKSDPDNPFGSLIKPGGQSYYTDENGKKQLSLINRPREEGDWSDWKDALPSQFLGKQSKTMAKKQLDLARIDKEDEFESICALNNPTVKKHLLKEFASKCDSAAVNLQAAALPGQKYHVIIPMNTLKDNEVYAPRYENGSKLALIRYPHGGTFEIPILTVNNRNKQGQEILGKVPLDAIGINSKNAERLSGADFDGDTAMCIPTHDKQGRVKITSTPQLKQLDGFDPKAEYGPGTYDPKTTKLMTKQYTQKQMGVVSNLITDMTLAGANSDELARAVKHSMVVIDAEKHKLDYRKSEIDNNIAELKRLYQPHDNNGLPAVKGGGASTLLSRAKGEATVEKRQGTPYTNIKGKPGYDPNRPEGALIYKTADDLYKAARTTNKKTGISTIKTVDGQTIKFDSKNPEEYDYYRPIKKVDPKTGEVRFTNKDGTLEYKKEPRTQASTRMAETDDAHTLVSTARHPMELIYADYANSMKALANKARLEEANTGKIEYSKEAKAKYSAEVKSLEDKLNTALLNAGRERAALRKMNATVAAKKLENPDMEAGDIKKAYQQALTKARDEVGSVTRRDRNIVINEREWEAIQSGAISESKLTKILNNADIDHLRSLATPRQSNEMSSVKIAKIKQLQNSNYTLEEIAKKMGVSTSTVSKYLKGGM